MSFFFLMVLVLVSYFGVICAHDLSLFYLFVEIQSLSFYTLCGLDRCSDFAVEAALRYFILSASVSCCLLFAFSVFYTIYGTLNLTDLALCLVFWNWNSCWFSFHTLSVLSYGFLCVTLLFKVGAAPFHFWMPSVYQSVSANLFFHFLVLPKILFVVIFTKILSTVELDKSFFVLVGLLSLYVGSFSTFNQKAIRRFLIFSSVHHIGFIFLGFSCDSFFSFYALCFYASTYLWSLQFGVPGVLSVTAYSRVQKQLLVRRYLHNFDSLVASNFYFCCVISVFIFSMAGVPPFLGFFAKLYILGALCLQKHYLLLTSALFISFASCYYYLRVAKTVWFSFDYKLYRHAFFGSLPGVQAAAISFLFISFMLAPLSLDLGDYFVKVFVSSFFI